MADGYLPPGTTQADLDRYDEGAPVECANCLEPCEPCEIDKRTGWCRGCRDEEQKAADRAAEEAHEYQQFLRDHAEGR